MSDPVLVFAAFRPAPGKEEASLSSLAPMLEHSQREQGNEFFDLYSSQSDQSSFHPLERYVNADAIEAHRASAYYKAYRSQLPELLASSVEVVVLATSDVS